MPFVFGLSKLDPRRFAALNFIGAFLWTLIFGTAGYLFGHIVEVVLVDIGKCEVWIALALVVTGIGASLLRHRAGMVAGRT